MNKRSISIRGHRTSFSLEDDFWLELKILAEQRQMSLAQLVTQIDSGRDADQNLSSSLRLYVLRHLKSRLETTQDQ